MKPGTSTLGRSVSTGRNSLLALGLLMVLAALLPRVAGFWGMDPYVVHGHSMAPTMPPGSMVWTRLVPGAEVRVGDVLVFEASWGSAERASMVVHRVVAVRAAEDGVLVYTRGDGSRGFDPEATLLRGDARLVTGSVPVVGHVYRGLKLSMFLAVAIAGCALFALSKPQRNPHSLRPIPLST